jgi:ABC-2 type transport system permease protein
MSVPATSPVGVAGAKLSFPRIIRSEWIKLRTVRSTVWCYALIFLITIGLTVLVASFVNRGGVAQTGLAAQATVVQVGTLGVHFSELIVAVLGALIITGEYSTGMIRSTFAAVPKRFGAIFAKAGVLAVTTFVVSAAAIWLGTLLATPILSSVRHVDVNLHASAVWMPLVGGAVFLTMIALLAFSFGLILRSTAAGIAIILGLLLVAPVIIEVIGGLTNAAWVLNIGQFLPASAGGQLMSYASTGAATGVSVGGRAASAAAVSGAITLNGWSGLGVIAAWDIIVGGVALFLLKRRDA